MANITESLLIELKINNDEYTKALIQAQEKTNGLTEEIKALKKAEGDNTAEIAKLTAERKKANQELATASRNYNNFKTSTNEATGVMEKQKAELSLLTERFNKMGTEAREAFGAETSANIKMISDDLKLTEKAYGDNRRNVGNYAEAVNIAMMSLGDMRKEMIALRNTSFAGKSEKEVQALKLRIGQLTDAMGDMKAEMKVMGTENAAVLVGGLKLIAAGVEGVVGSLSILGVENETIQKLESKMISLIAVTQALAEIEDTLSSGKARAMVLRIKDMAVNAAETVSKWANVTATNAQTRAEAAKTATMTTGSVVTKVITAVQWAWNAALAANPIGLVVAGIATLVAGIGALIYFMRDSTDATQAQTNAYNELALANKKAADADQFALDVMKARGVEGAKLTKAEKEMADSRVRELKKEIKALSDIEAAKDKEDRNYSEHNKKMEEYTAARRKQLLLGITYDKQVVDEKEANDKKEADDLKKKQEDYKKASDEKKKILQDENKEYQSILKSLSDLRNEQLEKSLTDDQKEIIQTSQKYDELIFKAKGHKDLILQIEKDKAKALADLAIEQQNEKSKKEQENQTKIDDAWEKFRKLQNEKANQLSNASDEITAETKKANEAKINNARLDLMQSFVKNMSALLGQDEKNRKRYGSALKALAIGEIAINLARQLSEIGLFSAKNPFNAATFGAAGAATAAIQTAIAVATAATQTALVIRQKYATGGFTGPGSYKDETGHKVAGVVHDGEWVASKRFVNSNPGLFASLQSRQQKGLYADGGFVQRSIVNSNNIVNFDTQSIINALQNMPAPVVTVEDINAVASRRARVINKATI